MIHVNLLNVPTLRKVLHEKNFLLRILTGKIHSQLKLKRLRKVCVHLGNQRIKSTIYKRFLCSN